MWSPLGQFPPQLGWLNFVTGLEGRMNAKWIRLIFVLVLFLAACAAPTATETAASQPTATEQASEETVPVIEATPTEAGLPVPVFDGAQKYRSSNNNTYISYEVPDTTVEVVAAFYREQLAAEGWEQKNKTDTGFGGSVTILRSKPDKNISVSIDTNVVNNGVRVLITIIPK
jgi:hypothetical protein